MSTPGDRSDLLSAEVPTGLLVPAALLAAALWWWSHQLPLRARKLALSLRWAIGAAAVWAGLQALGRFVSLATPCPLWIAAVVAAGAVETAASFYRHERKVIDPAAGKRLTALRSTTILLLVFVLVEPQKVAESALEKPREVVILIDASASMDLTDHRLGTSEKLALASVLGVESARRDRSLAEVSRALVALDRRLAMETEVLQRPRGTSEAAAGVLIANRSDALIEFLENASRDTLRLTESIAAERENGTGLTESTRALLSDYDTRIRETIATELDRAAAAVRSGDFTSARALAHSIGRQLRFVLRRLPSAAAEIDQLYYDSLPKSDRHEIDLAARRSRSEIARQVLRADPGYEGSLAERIGAKYRLRFIRYAGAAEPFDGDAWLEGESELPPPKTGGSHLGAALAEVISGIPMADLAGVVVIGDGRHFGEISAEAGARRLGLAGVPVCAIAIGGNVGPRDAAVLAVRAPQVVHVDDRATFWADVRLDGMAGQSVAVTLRREGETVASKTLEATNQSGVTAVKFTDAPGEIGVFDYEVHVSPPEADAAPEHDRRPFRMAVTDDRIDVLLADGRSRWEFRYLRNLFHARDPSVHLQHVLIEPDTIADAPPAPPVRASAGRKFGDAEATALPGAPEEWAAFDAIILGDLPPSSLSATDWRAIGRAVSERGTLLVAVAGPDHMPHAHSDPTLAELLPTLPAEAGLRDAPAGSYRLRLTESGANHPIMRPSNDAALDRLVWDSLPPLHWRATSGPPKPGAEVLAWAQRLNGPLSAPLATGIDTSAQANDAPLIISQRYGLGRTLLLNFDCTWRLRYATGDVHHHQFWGSVLQWGGGRLLRAGNDRLRLGTDRLTYAPGEMVRVSAKAFADTGEPLANARLKLALSNQDSTVASAALENVEGVAGNFGIEIQAPELPGEYVAELTLDTGDSTTVTTEIAVVDAGAGQELAELTVDRSSLEQLAVLSGGAVADPADADGILLYLREAGRTIVDRRVATLWDRVWIFGLILLSLTLEWTGRRRAGLS